MKNTVTLAALATVASAFPWVATQPGVDSTLLHSRQQPAKGPGSEKQCPFNPNHVPAAPITKKYIYNNATNGQKGNGKGGYLVPHPGDKAHAFKAPNPKTDIRGPCPGLNAAANHNFLARDGITTFSELVDAQQNLYNVGFDLAQTLALLGLTLTDGDIVTQKLSIGCDATSRTSYNPTLTGHEPGLDGHNKFEGDTSLTRDDYFLGNGDNFSFNGTLFKMMTDMTGSNYSFQQLADYRYARYNQSLQNNPDFYFGPLSLLLFGAASFLYELFPSGTHNYAPDFETISYFFGAKKQPDGSYTHVPEQIPPNWTNRVKPYSNGDVTSQIFSMYGQHPVLFGGSTGNGSFDALPSYGGIIENGKLNDNITAQQTTCFLYQLLTERVPSTLSTLLNPSLAALNLIDSLVGAHYQNLGCPKPVTK